LMTVTPTNRKNNNTKIENKNKMSSDRGSVADPKKSRKPVFGAKYVEVMELGLKRRKDRCYAVTIYLTYKSINMLLGVFAEAL